MVLIRLQRGVNMNVYTCINHSRQHIPTDFTSDLRPLTSIMILKHVKGLREVVCSLPLNNADSTKQKQPNYQTRSC